MFKKSLIIATLLGILLSVGCQDESVRPIPKKTPQEETSKDSDKKDTTKPEEEKSKDDQKPEDGDKPKDDQKPEGGDKPKDDQKPEGGDKPKDDQKPEDGDKPKDDQKPEDGNKPKDDQKPKDGDKPKDDQKPEDGDKPKDDQKPEDGDKPKDDQKPEEDHKEEDIPGLLFPQPDNARELTGYPAERLYAILTSKKFDQVLPLGGTHISKEQLAEIKAFTDQLIASSSAKNQKEKHDVLFRWIRKHVKYGHVVDPSIPDYNSAYTTFKYKNAICQGYSNLLKVFCYTQGINAPVVNGLARFNTLGNPGGHAWNYVLLDGKWYVSDATNGIFYDANDKKKFNYLLPEHIDFALWEDDKMVYTYQNRELTISAVRDSYSDSKLTVPYSVGGFRISNFNPNTISKSVREIYLGSNIKLLGPSDHRQLLISGKNLEKIAVDPKNPHLESYKGAIYDRKNSPDTPILIPAKLKHIYLKPIKQVGKNVIYGHLGVEVLHFAEGTEIIDNFAVENCPNLRTVYLSKSIKEVGNRAFDGCHPSLKKIQR